MITFRSFVLRLMILFLTGMWFLSSTEAFTANSKSAERQQMPIRIATPRSWALATTAILTERNHERHDLLGGCSPTQKNVTAWKKSLSDWWGIHNREDLLNGLQWIEDGGHRREFERLGAYLSSANDQQLAELVENAEQSKQARHQVNIARKYYEKLGIKSLLAWDYARFIALCRWGYLVGYLSEQEAWDRIMPAAAMLQSTFDSWKDFGENYLIGREFWSYEQTAKDDQLFRDIYRKLLNNSSSPWNRNPWNMDLHLN